MKKTKSSKKIALKITMSMTVAMSCDCLIESGSDWSADWFEPLGYFEMRMEDEGRSIKGTSLFYRVVVNVFFPPPEWVDFIDLREDVGEGGESECGRCRFFAP